MSGMEHLHSITPRRHSPAALFAFWVSVFFIPGLLIIGLIQTVAADHEQQLRHVARGRLIQQIRLFARELEQSFYIESLTSKILARLGASSLPGCETDVHRRAEMFQAAWRDETGSFPFMCVFGSRDLTSFASTISDARIRPPPSRIVSAWFRGMAGMESRRHLLVPGSPITSGVPAKIASKLMNDFLGIRSDIAPIQGRATTLFSTKNFGETMYFLLHLDTKTNLPDDPVEGGCILIIRDSDITKRGLLHHATSLSAERGIVRKMVSRPRSMSSLVGSWKPAGKGLAIECAAPLSLYDAHRRPDSTRMRCLRVEMKAEKLISPLRFHERTARVLVILVWTCGALFLLRLAVTGTIGLMALRTKLVILLSIAVGLPLILFLVTATAYGRFSDILARQERMNRIRQKLAQIESSVHSFGISAQRRVIEIRNHLSAVLGEDEQAVRTQIQALSRLHMYDAAYFIDTRGRTLYVPLSDLERKSDARLTQKKWHFFHPSLLAFLEARGNLSASMSERLSTSINPMFSEFNVLKNLSSMNTNDIIVQEGRIFDIEVPLIGTLHFQLFFPFRQSPDGSACEDAVLLLIGRPELVPTAAFDSLFRTSSSYYREMDGEYETRIALFRIDPEAPDRLVNTVSWPSMAFSDTDVTSLARRALKNNWSGVISRSDEAIEAARIFSKYPFIAVGIAASRGRLQQGDLNLAFWVLAAYTLALLALAGHFLGRLFAVPLDGLIAAVHRLRHGEFGLAVEIRSADEFEVIGNEISRMSRGVRERNRLRRFVSGLAAEAAATGREAGTRVEMTILFAHIRDFSTVSNSLGASRTVTLLNGYFTTMETAIVSQNGTIDKFIGDSIMAVFHPDRTGPTHPVSACKAVMTMQQALRDFNLVRAAEGDREIAIGIGIATGTVISGRVGSAIRRQDFTVIGDTVNLAARLSSLACSETFGSVLLSDATVSRLGPGFRTRAAGEVRVKGKLEPVSVHELEYSEAG